MRALQESKRKQLNNAWGGRVFRVHHLIKSLLTTTTQNRSRPQQ